MLHATTSAAVAPTTAIHGHDAPPTAAAGGGAGSILTGAPMSALRARARGAKPAAATRNWPARRNGTAVLNVFGGTSTCIETRRSAPPVDSVTTITGRVVPGSKPPGP